MGTKIVILPLLLLVLIACTPSSTRSPGSEPERPIVMAAGAPLSFILPAGWTTSEREFATILTPLSPQSTSSSIAIQPFAKAGNTPAAAIPLVKRSFEAVPAVARFSMGPTFPTTIDGTAAVDYRAEFLYFDVPMYRHGIIVALDDLLIDIAITSPATEVVPSDFALGRLADTITIPPSMRTIARKGIGTDSRL